MEPVARTAGFFDSKALRPLLAWIVLSVVLLTWQNHRRQEQRATINFTVMLEGRTVHLTRSEYRAELDGEIYDAGRHSGLWRKRLTIQAPDAETFSTNVLVWYGGKDLGNITLARSRGTLDLNLKPAAIRVSVWGAETNRSFPNSAHESLSLPTGRYHITATFARFETNRAVEIVAHQTSHLLIDAGITALNLISEPTNAEFELNSVAVPEVSILSNTPVTLTDLPAGDYKLRIWRDDYQKTVRLRLNPALRTNELKVEFDYARLTITSLPNGAQITEGDKRLGITPATFTLPAGWHRLAVAKDGFRATNCSLTLEANETNSLAVMLWSRAYLEAVELARDQMSGAFADLDRALESIDKALQVQPDDPAASQLKQSILLQRHLRDAGAFHREGVYGKASAEVEAALKISATDPDALALQRDLEKDMQSAAQARAQARREFPARTFQERVSRLPQSDLFPAQKIEFSGKMATARAALVRALGKNPAWSVRRNDTADPDTAIIQAEIKSLGSRQSAFFVVGQTTDNTVEIHFKLWLYSLGGNIQIGLTGISDESYKPVHPSFAPSTAAASIEQRRTRDLQEFRKRLEAELR